MRKNPESEGVIEFLILATLLGILGYIWYLTKDLKAGDVQQLSANIKRLNDFVAKLPI